MPVPTCYHKLNTRGQWPIVSPYFNKVITTSWPSGSYRYELNIEQILNELFMLDYVKHTRLIIINSMQTLLDSPAAVAFTMFPYFGSKTD